MLLVMLQAVWKLPAEHLPSLILCWASLCNSSLHTTADFPEVYAEQDLFLVPIPFAQRAPEIPPVKKRNSTG